METLDALRQKIDAIDNDIIKKLEERTGLVEQVGHIKRQSGNSSSFIRSGREASMVRNLVKNTQGHFPKPAIVAIWRVIIASSLGIEQKMRIAAYRTSGQETCFWRAREYFGTFTPVEAKNDPSEVMESLTDGANSVGVLPMPWHDADSNRWWLELRNNGLKIFARIPFIDDVEEVLLDEVVAIAPVQPEPTGDDTTLFAIEMASDAKDKTILSALQKEGFKVVKQCSAMEQDDVVLLVYVKGFHPENSHAVQALANAEGVRKLTFLGAYANSIAL